MKQSKSFSKNDKIRIYINISKAYYYPGEKLGASILLDVFDKTKCDKLQVIAKGKIKINAVHSSPSSDDEDENVIKPDPEKKSKKNKKIRKLREVNIEDTSSEDEEYIEAAGITRKFSETKEIFKFRKTIKLTSDEYLKQGKYSFPFELELPENIPGSFLYIEKKAYVEIAYSLKVKLNKIMLKEVIPIVVRQRESTFNYKRNNEFEKSILGCCCDNNTAKITVTTPNKYYLSNEEVELNIIIDNKKNDIVGSPLYVELYQRIILFPKDISKKIKITNLVGQHFGKKPIHSRKIYHKDISFYVKKLECSYKDLLKAMALKHYKHKDVLSFLNSSVNCDLVICEYEAYCAVQYPNWNDEELGVFISVLLYPPTEGIVSKSVSQISKEFNKSIINKKIFLSQNENKENSKFDKYDDEFEKKRFHKYDDGSDEKFKKKMMQIEESKNKEKKKIKEKKNKDEDDDDEINDKKDFKNNNINNISKNDKMNSINKNINLKNENNIINTKLNQKNQISDIDTINSLQIKKNFNGDFLKDALDNEFLDKESFQ